VTAQSNKELLDLLSQKGSLSSGSPKHKNKGGLQPTEQSADWESGVLYTKGEESIFRLPKKKNFVTGYRSRKQIKQGALKHPHRNSDIKNKDWYRAIPSTHHL